MDDARLDRDDAEDIWLTAAIQSPAQLRHGLVRERHLTRRGRSVLDRLRAALELRGFERIEPRMLDLSAEALRSIPVRYGQGPISKEAQEGAAEVILLHWRRVAMAHALREAAKVAEAEGPEASDRKLAEMRRDIDSMSRGIQWVGPRQAVAEFLTWKHKLLDPSQRIATDFPMLDRVTSGWAAGDETCIQTYTNMGKSTLATQLVISMAMNGTPVAYVNLEDPHRTMGGRHVGMFTEDHNLELLRRISDNRHTHSDVSAIDADLRAAPLDSYPMHTAYMPGATVERIAAAIVDAARMGCRVVAVDYAQKIPTPTAKSKSDREAMLPHLVDYLHNVASEHGVHLIVVIQVTRPQSKDPGSVPPPGLHSARGSGEFENNATTIIVPWRPQKNAEDEETGFEPAQLIVPKVKMGRPDTFDVLWDADRYMFRLKDE